MDPYLGYITMFAGNFAPRGWAFCDGQLLPIASNSALFSLLGTQFGGDGRTTFGLPDLRGRVPVHSGKGQGLTPRVQGEPGGQESVTLTQSQTPSHAHALLASTQEATDSSPEKRVLAASSKWAVYGGTDATEPMDSNALTNAGGGQAHTNMMPYQCINFIIALQGIYPSRS